MIQLLRKRPLVAIKKISKLIRNVYEEYDKEGVGIRK